MKLADRIRGFVIDELITPARQEGQGQITVRAGDIHQSLGLDNRMPAVCSALDAAKFCDQAGVTLIQRSGPHHGSTTEWVLGL